MRRIRRWVDAETVRLPQAIVYCAYIVAGVQSLALGAPPNAVAQAMGRSVAALAICGALVTWRDARRIRQVSKRIQAFEEGCARE